MAGYFTSIPLWPLMHIQLPRLLGGILLIVCLLTNFPKIEIYAFFRSKMKTGGYCVRILYLKIIYKHLRRYVRRTIRAMTLNSSIAT